jgi:hypothetical protein
MFEADLTNPMNTVEAVKRFECPECRGGGNCEFDCVESATCSIHCSHCDERNWFHGDLPDAWWKGEATFKCCACGKESAKRRMWKR